MRVAILKLMRPQILFPLFAPATALKGVGPRIAPLVERTAGPLVRDLLFHAPAAVLSRSRKTLAETRDGETPILELRILAHVPPRRRGQPYQIRATDGTGEVVLAWFAGYGEHLLHQHPEGSIRAASGRLDRHRDRPVLAHPDFLLPLERISEIPEQEAVYPATEGLSSRQIRRFALQALARAPELPEWRTAPGADAWPSWREALDRLHHPKDEHDLDGRAPARARLAYDELLAHQLALARRRSGGAEAAERFTRSRVAAALEAALPFRLTEAQVRCLTEIRGDLGRGLRMSRLLQGDVGSGKTVVAMIAMAEVAAAGRQAALMAPTDILARQHFETLCGPLTEVGLPPLLLTGRDKGPGRLRKLEQLAAGACKVVVGTHALFQDDVAFEGLRLVVIDEQHRFGVSERQRLQSKGARPHVLALSATPIPRTLELTLFGDLDVSRLDQKPAGRLPVDTVAAPTTRLGEVVERLRSAVAGGAQAFWICPLVSESEDVAATAAEDRAAALREALGPDRVGLVHGQMAASEKDRVMAEFAEGRLGVLVATTVVEVGVNVPNASIMVIEHAERFGLAQLHQLRGRVGRGERKSACLLLYDPPLSAHAKARLEILRETEDGFLIAERDLDLRGGGDPIGLRQSGFPEYRFADPVAHRDLLLRAAEEVRYVLARDPALESPTGQALRILEALFDWGGRLGWAKAG